jgi:hypothetical protein
MEQRMLSIHCLRLGRSREAVEVVGHSEFSLGVLRGHVPDLPEDWPLRAPSSIVAAKHPEDPGATVRIATV